MNDDGERLLNRRRVLYAALLGGGAAALPACAPREEAAANDLWAGFEHSFFLSGAGLLLSCGAGDLGQLGQGGLADAHAPAAVVGLAVLVHTATYG